MLHSTILLMAMCVAGCGGGQGARDAGQTDTAGDGGDGLDALDGDDGSDAGGDHGDVVRDPEDDDGGSYHVTLPFTADVDGTGSIRIGEVLLARAAGTAVVLGDGTPALAYQITDWAAYGYTLLHVIAPEVDDLNVMYLYCTTAGLAWVWHEDWTLAMDFETGSGACTFAAASTAVTVPPLRTPESRPSASQLVEGFTLSGADVSYSIGPGTIQWEGEAMDLFPFEVVDCSTDCTADPADGWWELHSVVVGPGSGTCFGILYLIKSTPDRVQLGYPVCLDPVRIRADAWLDATWTVPAGAGGAVLPGPRPAGLTHVLRPLPPLGNVVL